MNEIETHRTFHTESKNDYNLDKGVYPRGHYHPNISFIRFQLEKHT